MRVFLAGATGAVGTHLVPQLLEHGHTVVGTSRSAEGAARLRAAGADGVVLDLLDAWAVHDAVRDARPDAIVHQATALKEMKNFRNFDRGFAPTNQLRTRGTDALLAAASEGVFVGSWPKALRAPGTRASVGQPRPRPIHSIRHPSLRWARPTLRCAISTRR